MNRHLLVVVFDLIAGMTIAIQLEVFPNPTIKKLVRYFLVSYTVNLLISLIEVWTR